MQPRITYSDTVSQLIELSLKVNKDMYAPGPFSKTSTPAHRAIEEKSICNESRRL